MQSASRLYHVAHLTGLQCKSSILKLLLHIAPAEVSQIAALSGRRAVGLRQRQLAQGDAALDLLLMLLDDLQGVLL